MIGNPAIGDLGNRTAEGYFSSLISTFITFLLVIGAIAFVFWFLLGAVKYITSSGDKMKAEEARKTLTQALIGIVLLIATWAILNLIQSIFGITLTTITFSDFYIR